MCDHDPARRWFLGAVGAAAVGAVAGLSIDELASGQVGEPEPTTTTEPLFGGLQIRPRASWGADLPPKGPLSAEDSRFILIHHTASPNDGRDPRQLVRATYGYHAGPKGWPDICYNFMVGHDGSVWEAHAGSLAGPILADATGGSQGYGQLICMIGDFSNATPPPAMRDAVIALTAFIADRDSIDLTAGATVAFTSRGSDKFPAGTPMRVRTVSGHRDCTYTGCPGDGAYRLLPSWQAAAQALLEEGPSRFAHADRLGPPRP
jgi:hypothetical protein